MGTILNILLAILAIAIVIKFFKWIICGFIGLFENSEGLVCWVIVAIVGCLFYKYFDISLIS